MVVKMVPKRGAVELSQIFYASSIKSLERQSRLEGCLHAPTPLLRR